MTASLAQQTVATKDPSAVRKRRRRAPAGGASDDCFSCSKKNIKCDRRRPYCSQCLEVGSECSGYKTQLTWGVGVASRGKLRGLSLPVAKAPPVTREPKKLPPARSRSSSSIIITSPQQDEPVVMPRGPIDIPSAAQTHAHTHAHVHAHAHAHAHTHTHTHAHAHAHAHIASAPTTPYPMAGYDYLSMSHPENTPPLPQGSWGSITYSPVLSHSPDTTPKFNRFPLPLVTEDLSSSIDSLHDVDYLSPMSQSYTREDMPYVHSPTFIYENYATGNSSPGPQSPPSSLYLDHSRQIAPTSCPSLVHAPSDPGSSIHSHMDQLDSHIGQKLVQDCDNFSVPEADAYSTSYNSAPRVWRSPSVQDEDARSYHSEFAPSHWPTTSETKPMHMSQDLVSKMPFFMDYYENVMCPSMVFIDGPQNPFRGHVLRLAGSSQSLRHAICALASCNLRMKRELSLGHGYRDLSEKLMAKHAAEAATDAQPQNQSLTEEYQHRNMAVHLLNKQLNDPSQSNQDSVLATILLLCHYRMVESGIAKFHTQFAGVNKILALRYRQFANSGDSTWMEALFTYFDAISASTNDRESQLNPAYAHLEPDALTLPIGAENLVGCDRELFKTIRKLGRLNLLSQNRPVQNPRASFGSQNVAVSSHSPSSTYLSPMGHLHKDDATPGAAQTYKLGDFSNSFISHQFDGNGQVTGHNGNNGFDSATPPSPTTYDIDRTVFWQEWKEARVALQEWQFDAPCVANSLPGSPSPSQLRDLHSLSEAFRYAALLYTERLVSPSLPSSHQSIQDIVSQVMFYVTSLETGSSAEKFLLWPLFIAGSECVNEMQQSIVRNKCHEMMSRSGYMNNLAALEVLEKLWAGEWSSPDGLLHPESQVKAQRGPFNWTNCIGGPGVEVEWMMF